MILREIFLLLFFYSADKKRTRPNSQ